jgi:hypothetical protein
VILSMVASVQVSRGSYDSTTRTTAWLLLVSGCEAAGLVLLLGFWVAVDKPGHKLGSTTSTTATCVWGHASNLW